MAKDIIKSLCVAEHIDTDPTGEIAWRTIADCNTPPRQPDKIRLYQVDKAQETTLRYKAPKIGEVAILEWLDSPPAAGTEIREARGIQNQTVYELIDPMEFKGIYIEDENDIRRVLKEGFALFETPKTSFKAGQTALVVILPSKTGKTYGLVINEKDKLFISKPVDMPKSFWEAKIEAKPEDPKRFVEKMSVVQLDDMKEVQYTYGGFSATAGAKARRFLDSEPKVVRSFLPYSPEEFAPILLKRELALAAKNCNLSTGRKLTKVELNEIFSFIETSLKEQTSITDTLKIDDPEVIELVSKGVMAMMPSIKKDAETDGGFTDNLRKLLFSDESIREICMKQARKDWESDNAKEIQAKQTELRDLESKVSKKEEKEQELAIHCNRLETHLKELSDEIKQKESALNNVANGLHAVVASYRGDLAKLIASSGCNGLAALPITIPGYTIDGLESSPTALIRNLTSFLKPDDAKTVASYLEQSVQDGYHIAVGDEYAALVADALSLAQEGKTADVVVRTDRDCDFASIRAAIINATSQVVLVEGVLGCTEDYQVLALARHCQGKIIVFSIDDAYNAQKISASVFRRVAMVSNLQYHEAAQLMDQQKLKNSIVRPEMFTPNPNVWKKKAGNQDINKFITRQRELMQLDA